MTVVDRAFEVAAATLPRAPKDRLAYAGMNETEPDPKSRLLGEPIRIDPTLPRNSMLLEPEQD